MLPKLLPSPKIARFTRKPPQVEWQRREIARRAMTIGIGMLCAPGAVIASDTRVIGSDGLTHDESKIRVETSASGVFVTTYSAQDVNAVKTLINDVFEELLRSDLRTLRDVENTVRPVMGRWSASHPHGPPLGDFILGAALSTPWTPDRSTCGGLGLYHCEPPASITRKHFLEPVPSTYVAIGEGASITDPLHKSLFGSMTNPTVCLKQVAYLMYRAKKDFASACGGGTTAVFLRQSNPAAFEIAPIYMDVAEQYSALFDSTLSTAGTAILSSTLEDSMKMCELFRSFVEAMSGYREARFLTRFNQEICDDGSIRLISLRNSGD
jgi:hypothetical protein